MWFNATLLDNIGFSNAPDQPELIYGNAFFPLRQPVELTAGDAIEVTLKANLVGEDYIWSWNTRVTSQGCAKADFRQSTFFGAPLSPERLGKRAASYEPALSEDGEVDKAALVLMAEGKRLESIAQELAARFPRRFSSWQDALSRVGELSVKYSR
jgi:protein arginine N-methyltransferase 1